MSGFSKVMATMVPGRHSLPGVGVLTVRHREPEHWSGSAAARTSVGSLLAHAFSASRFELVLGDDPDRRTLGRASVARIVPAPARRRRFDVLFVAVDRLSDLVALDSVPGWRSLASRIVVVHCDNGSALHAGGAGATGLMDFELVATTRPGSVELDGGELMGLLPATDTMAYLPPVGIDRPIDVLAFDATDSRRHRTFTLWAARHGRAYVADGNSAVWPESGPAPLTPQFALTQSTFVMLDDPAQDRRRMGDEQSLTATSQRPTIGMIDAIACGCGIVGRLPQGGGVRDAFGHLPGVIDFDPSCAEVPDGIHQVTMNPDGATAMAAFHRSEALWRHDVAHRASQVLARLDITVPDSIRRRIEALDALASVTMHLADRGSAGNRREALMPIAVDGEPAVTLGPPVGSRRGIDIRIGTASRIPT
jgi:hypothetical protein